jgi:phosphoglycolate phosphatase
MVEQNRAALRYDMLVWDWDGTIMNSTPTIVECLQKACVELGIEPPSDQIASHVIGLGLYESLKITLPSVAKSEYPIVLERFRKYYLVKDQDLMLFSGIRDLLHDLKSRGYLMAVATGKPRIGLNRSLQNHQLEHFFHDTKTADEARAKPHPQMLLELLEAHRLTPQRVLMIGDTTHDLKMAQSAGVDALAVSYGAHPAQELKAYQPIACVASVEALRLVLDELVV